MALQSIVSQGVASSCHSLPCFAMSLNLTRAAKRSRTSAVQPVQQPMLNPLAMMMMNPALAQMNPFMNPMSSMPQAMPAPVQEHDSADEDNEAAAVDAPLSRDGNAGSAMPAAGSAIPPAVLPAAAPVPAEDADPSNVHQRLHDALITRSATYLKNIARNRLSDGLERMHSQFDATYTAECTRNGLLCLLWIMCRLKPNVKISDLRTLVFRCAVSLCCFGVCNNACVTLIAMIQHT